MFSPSVVYALKILRGLFSGILLIYSVVIIYLGLYHDANIAQFGGTLPEVFLLLASLLLLAANEGFQVIVVW